MALSPKQARFVAEYLIDLNATQAAIRAGYSKRSAEVTGSRLLGNHKVREAVEKGTAAKAKRLDLSADRVLLELMRIGMADISQAFGDDGQLLPIKDIPEDVRRAISGVEAEELFEGKGEDRAHVGTLRKVRFWDKPKALEMLGKHLKLFTDVLETKVKGMPREQRAERVAQLLAEALERRRRVGAGGP